MVTTDNETTVDAADAAAPPVAPTRRPSALWLPVMLVVGLVLGIGIGLVVPRSATPGEDSVEAGFARDMSTHHAQAVEMGMIGYTRAADPDVRIMARDIALTQQGQIGMMQAWLREWQLDPTGSRPPMAWMPEGGAALRDGLMPGMATKAEIQALRDATGTGVDLLFLRLMVQHHLGGIHMAEEVLKTTGNDQVEDMARTAMNGQQRELTDMRSLQQRLS